MQKDQIVIFGCGGHSRSVADVLLSDRPDACLIFVDEGAKENETLFGFPVVPTFRPENHPYFFAIGNNEKRQKKYEEVGPVGLIPIISPKASIGRQSNLGAGIFVGNHAHIGPEAIIGDNTILNTGCIVEHEVKIGMHCHIGPRAVISGRCKMGDRVFIGVGAVIKDGISICSDVIIGAGAVIVKPIQEPGTYIGCPGKKIR